METVATWADGFGRWHAPVRFDAAGYGSDVMAAHAVRVRARACRAVRREVAVSGEAVPGWRCRVDVVDTT
ncbi:hypothetical protein DFR72_12521 [Lentzea flaviverrucosa]|uniref:Uncharacterized protein n=1 Tax=Lentzea flaviverrucosa TaxID=200379 RepID=A0A1H9XYL8_9PSEU|nr:hypothetical protein DFR72_12521 [Lentzea flaviverrucosa]SES51201.1 hypothetical protein SAMN05216195_12717 [Lentzea flaviverrucosa]